MTTADLPAVNATLNALAGLALTAGYYFIRRKDVRRHKFCMLTAFGISTVFLICYVTYHALHGSKSFAHSGSIRVVYFGILISHVVLAAAVPPLAILTLIAGLRDRIERHRRLARWTWPIWMYVSVTGVLVYFMLYRWFPPPHG